MNTTRNGEDKRTVRNRPNAPSQPSAGVSVSIDTDTRHGDRQRGPRGPHRATTGWACPCCEWTYRSPIPVAAVWHRCPSRDQARRYLKPVTS